MAKWTVAEPEISGGRRFYLRRDSEYFMCFREDLGWTREDVQILADRRNAREKPRFVATYEPSDLMTDRLDVWMVREGEGGRTVALFYNPGAEQHAKDHAAKLNKECGQ